MKLNRIITLCAVAAALVLTAGTAMAQNGGGGGGGNGGGGGGGGRRGNFDPAAMMQRTMDRLGFTNDTDAAAVQPLVQKVMDAQTALRAGGFGGRGGRGGQGGGGNGGGGGGQNAQTNPDRQALQDAIENDAPTAQIKELLAKFQASQKAKRDTLASAQADLRKVLNGKQEAQATLMGLLD